MYYHGARYYIPWLCRWAACDPINSEIYNASKDNSDKNRNRDFLELCASTYEYSYDNPVRFLDLTGEQPAVKTIKTSTGTYTSSPEKLQQARDQNKDPSLRIIDVLLPDSTRQNPPSGSTPVTNTPRTSTFDPRYNPPPGQSITTNLVVDFSQNSSKIQDTKQAIRNIEPIIEALKGNPKLSITLSGNTAYSKSQKDIKEDGNPSTSEQLMEHRAEAIKNLMIKEGVNPAQIKTSPGKPESTINATGTIKNNEKKID